MPFNLIDQKIRGAFSDAAIQYDVLTGLHKEIGRELIDQIKDHEPSQYILDVGMGTGWFTNRLTYFFPDSIVVGLDFAPGMIEWAKKYNEGFRIIEGDARRMPFKKETFDIIVSNLSYQWVFNLNEAFQLAHQLLRGNGLFCFNMFGGKTFEELFESLGRTIDRKDKSEQILIKRLASDADIGRALANSGFHDVNLRQELIKVHFPDMVSLIKWIKDIGANQVEKEFFIGRELFQRANDYYNEHFRDRLGIVATFEVIWVKAKK